MAGSRATGSRATGSRGSRREQRSRDQLRAGAAGHSLGIRLALVGVVLAVPLLWFLWPALVAKRGPEPGPAEVAQGAAGAPPVAAEEEVETAATASPTSSTSDPVAEGPSPNPSTATSTEPPPSPPPAPPKRLERLRARVLGEYPHDRSAFTQGLLWHAGTLYESTGVYGQSTLRRVDLATGEPLQRLSLAQNYFGEGLERVGDRLYQLTWRAGTVLLYDLETFRRLGSMHYQGEGWGLCFAGRDLVMSNGSSSLTLRDPATFQVRSRVEVTLDGAPVRWLNELECVGGEVYANIYQQEWIARIDLATGRVTGVIDVSGLLRDEDRVGVDVVNGIAYVPERDVFLLTGKLWPKVFEVVFEPAP